MSASDVVDAPLHRHVNAMNVGAVEAHNSEEPSMRTITIIGLDIAKSLFQLDGIDAPGKVRQPRRKTYIR